MTRAGSGLSSLSDSPAAAKEALEEAMAEAGIDDASLPRIRIRDACSPETMAEVVALQEGTGGARIVGCTGFGVMTAEGEIERKPGMSILIIGGNGPHAAPFLVEGLQKAPLASGRAPQGNSRRTREREAIIVGGGAAEDGSLGKTLQFLDGKARTNTVSGVVFAGRRETIYWNISSVLARGRAEAHDAVGGERRLGNFRQTRFRRLRRSSRPEMDGKCRARHHKSIIAIRGDPDQVALDHGDYVVRPIVGADTKRGIIALPTPVRTGQAITFARRDGRGARKDFQAMLEKGARRFVATHREDTRAFGLYFNNLRWPGQRALRRGVRRRQGDSREDKRTASRQFLHRLRDCAHQRHRPPPPVFRRAGARGKGI